jgi:hypothetical protein
VGYRESGTAEDRVIDASFNDSYASLTKFEIANYDTAGKAEYEKDKSTINYIGMPSTFV